MIVLSPVQVFSLALLFLGFLTQSEPEHQDFGRGMVSASMFVLIFTGLFSLVT